MSEPKIKFLILTWPGPGVTPGAAVTPGSTRAVVGATHSLGLQIDLLEAADTVLLDPDGFNSSPGPWQEGLYPRSAVPQPVPVALSKSPYSGFLSSWDFQN